MGEYLRPYELNKKPHYLTNHLEGEFLRVNLTTLCSLSEAMGDLFLRLPDVQYEVRTLVQFLPFPFLPKWAAFPASFAGRETM